MQRSSSIASNVMKISNIQLGSFLFDLMKTNMKQEFVMPWCKRLFVGAHFHINEETKVQLLCNREKNQYKKLESKSDSISSLFRIPGVGHTKMDTHTVYRLRLERSTYAWKNKKIKFLMPPVLSPIKIGVDHN
jgi:hypothetical protein